MKTIEFRVRPVTRYVVTKYESDDKSAGVETIGEFENEEYATRVMKALEAHEQVLEP